MKKLYPVLFLFGLILFFLTGCGGSSSSTSSSIAVETVTQTIVSSEGGTLSFDDGTSVEIPASALTSDEVVSVNKPTSTDDLPSYLLNTIYISAETTTNLNFLFG